VREEGTGQLVASFGCDATSFADRMSDVACVVVSQADALARLLADHQLELPPRTLYGALARNELLSGTPVNVDGYCGVGAAEEPWLQRPALLSATLADAPLPLKNSAPPEGAMAASAQAPGTAPPLMLAQLEQGTLAEAGVEAGPGSGTGAEGGDGDGDWEDALKGISGSPVLLAESTDKAVGMVIGTVASPEGANSGSRAPKRKRPGVEEGALLRPSDEDDLDSPLLTTLRDDGDWRWGVPGLKQRGYTVPRDTAVWQLPRVLGLGSKGKGLAYVPSTYLAQFLHDVRLLHRQLREGGGTLRVDQTGQHVPVREAVVDCELLDQEALVRLRSEAGFASLSRRKLILPVNHMEPYHRRLVHVTWMP
jgi:hypothetical protein